MKLVPFDTMIAAKNKDSEAVAEIVASFEKFINKRCIYHRWERTGTLRKEMDEDLRQISIIALLSAISGFKLQGVSSGPDDDDYKHSNQLLFIRYCAVTIENAIKDAHNKRAVLAEAEYSLEEISEDELAVISPEIEDADWYLFEPYSFEVLGRKIYVRNRNLAEALKYQPWFVRDPFLAKYYFHYTDTKLAELFNISESTVRRRRKQLSQDLRVFLKSLEQF